jgi:lipoic acid synthetase
MSMGFDHVAAGPLVRSSHHADEHIPQSEPGTGPLAAETADGRR